MKTVGIVGGSGFIGSFVTQKFLREHYKVRVSATDISKQEKYQHLRGLENAANLEIVPVNSVACEGGLFAFGVVAVSYELFGTGEARCHVR